MSVIRQIQSIKNQLEQGYFLRSKATGGSFLQRRKNNTSILHRPKEKVMLTKGRRKMLEAQLKSLSGLLKFDTLWESKMGDTHTPPRNTRYSRGGKPIQEKPKLIKGMVIRGTYSHAQHGPLKR